MHHLNRQKPNIEEAYEKYADNLYRIALTSLSNDADAQDAVQDVFIKYLTKATVFESPEHEKAWLIRATVNRCHDIVRWRKLRTHLPLDEAVNIASEENSGTTEIMELLEQIPSKYKDTLILHCLEGYTMEETASILGISLSAVKMRISRAREALRKFRKDESDV